MENYFKSLSEKFEDKTVTNHGVTSKVKDLESMYILTEKLNQDIQSQKLEFLNEKTKLINQHNEQLAYLSQIYADARSPLSEMFNMIDLLKQSNLSADQVRYLNILRTSIEFVAQRVQQANDFTKIESGEFAPKFVRFNLQGILFETYEYFKLRALKKGIDLNLVIPENFWRFYKSDPFRVTQILNSLLENSINFSQEGEIDFIIEQTNRFGTMVELKFVIKDTGNGVKLDKFNKLFQQVKMKYSTNIANETKELDKASFNTITKMARYMGGDVKIESSGYQNGVQFTLTLPLEVASE
jgi:signal transduction histidine kinase|tara:strand:+ start:497 stop:1390 length:894 start_codon:yes stop_codon:yes gene_type:complete